MGTSQRKALLFKLEGIRKSRVITYVLGDRPVAQAGIASDAMRPLFDQLELLGGGKKINQAIDLFIFSRGGGVEVPWPMVNAIRQYSSGFRVLVPYRAHSAATMISLGADKIVMGRRAELGPIDPQLTVQTSHGNVQIQRRFGVEDVMSYLEFIKTHGGIGDQAGLTKLIEKLAESVDPVTLGEVNRMHSHIRLVGRKLLSLHKPPLGESLVASLIDGLTEKLFMHGHSIGRAEAKEMGLDISFMTDEEETLCWNLFEEYETLLKLKETQEAEGYFPDDSTDRHEEVDVVLALIESSKQAYAFQGTLQINRIRKTPPQLNLQVALNIGTPQQAVAGMSSEELQALMQQISQAALNEIVPQVSKQIKEKMIEESPVEGVNSKFIGARWGVLREPAS